jgi:4-aminobutyrate aminotransferase-like enzyme
VGSYLAASLRSLGLTVRAAGLFVGVDLPSMHETLRVVNALRERGVLVAASGADNDSLKIRPPLVFNRADADRLLTELAAVLKPQ